jgi:hypothetical protein
VPALFYEARGKQGADQISALSQGRALSNGEPRDSQYEADKKELGNYYMDAMIHGDSDLMSELADEMTALDEQYAADRAEIEKE